MNGYQKMKTIRGMKIVKIISTITAVSMAVTGLAVGASANSASPDAISAALGELTDYGIVADNLTTSSHFESNFAVNHLKLNNNFDLNRYVIQKSRVIDFKITSDENFDDGEKHHIYGIYKNGEIINILRDGETKPAIIDVVFDKKETKMFSVTVPAEYRYDTLYIHQLTDDLRIDNEVAPVEVKAFGDSDQTLQFAAGTCVISESLTIGVPEALSHNKDVRVGSDIYSNFSYNEGERAYFYSQQRNEWINGVITPVFDADGNPVMDSTKAATDNTVVSEMENAADYVNGLLAKMQEASAALAEVNSGSDKVIYREITVGDSGVNGDDVAKIHEVYTFIKDNPDYVLLVNVNLHKGDNRIVFNSGSIGDWDADAASRIVFNFIGGGDAEDTSVVLGDGFRGTALAANASVRNESTFCGAVYAPNYTVQNGELHMAPYAGKMRASYEATYTAPVITTTTTATTPAETTTTTTENTTFNGDDDENTTTPVQEVTTTPEEEVTTTPEVTTAPVVTTTTTVLTTTTTVPVTTYSGDEDEGEQPPIVIIEEDIPLGDVPMSTGVDSHVGMFLIIGAAALCIGVGAQVFTVVLKKKN